VDEFAGSRESAQIEPHEFVEVGPDVVVPWTAHFKGRDGVEVQAQVAWAFTVQGGQLERACVYQKQQDALDAA
jgi:ketosteroid isomerase-like protein